MLFSFVDHDLLRLWTNERLDGDRYALTPRGRRLLSARQRSAQAA